MSVFESVNVRIPANIYFDGKVTSRTVEFSDGRSKTLGIMLPGDYTFNTGKPELMEFTAGRADVQLPGADTWQTFSAGESFHVPGHAAFSLKVHEVVDYICSFLEE